MLLYKYSQLTLVKTVMNEVINNPEPQRHLPKALLAAGLAVTAFGTGALAANVLSPNRTQLTDGDILPQSTTTVPETSFDISPIPPSPRPVTIEVPVPDISETTTSTSSPTKKATTSTTQRPKPMPTTTVTLNPPNKPVTPTAPPRPPVATTRPSTTTSTSSTTSTTTTVAR
jgi:hypothetical protein